MIILLLQIKNNSIIRKIFISILVFLFIFSPFFVSEAAINKQINYQGKLTTSAGVAVANGTYIMEFKLYTVATLGTAIWTETRTGVDEVQVTNGLFSVMLGEVTPLTGVDFNQTLYLGVTIESDAEMTPRKKLGTVPSAVIAENALNITGGGAGTIPYQSATNTTAFSAVGVTGQALISGNTGSPTWFAPTLGSVLFAGTNGVLSQDNTNFFWDDTNNRLGIGTTAPQHALDVAGAINSTSSSFYTRMYSSTNYGYLITNSPALYFSSPLRVNGGGIGSYTGDTYIQTNGSTKVTVTTAGAVGIGTTSPTSATMLDIVGSTPTIRQSVERASGGVAFNVFSLNAKNTTSGLSTSFGAIGVYGSLSTAPTAPFVNYIYMGSASDTDYLNNTFRLYPNDTATFKGNVGIGTTAPFSRLDVTNTSSGAETEILRLSNLATADNTAASLVFNLSTVEADSAKITAIRTNNPVSSDTALTFSTVQNGSLGERVRILPAGNVGIGTTGPATNLEIYGATSPALRLSHGGSGFQFNSVSAGADTRMDLSYYATGVFHKNLLSANYNGNVGIGTTTPNQQLEITKNFRLPSTTYNAGAPYGIMYKDANPFIHDFNYGNNGTVTTLGRNTFVGILAGNLTMGSTATLNHQASYNTAMGYGALSVNTTGYQNSAMGYGTLFANTTGYGNSALGYSSLYSNTTGSNNVSVGYAALYLNTTGNNNVAIGNGAGRFIADGVTGRTNGNYGIYIGDLTKASADGTNNEIVIGYNAIGQGSNSVMLGSSAVTKTILNGNVGIGTTESTTPLHVAYPYAKTDTTERNVFTLSSNDAPFSSAANKLTVTAVGHASSQVYRQWNFQTSVATTNLGYLNLQPLGGNVGIGTTTPGRKLEVFSSTTNLARMRISGTGTTAGNFSGYEINGYGGDAAAFAGGLFREESTDRIAIWTSSAERMTILQSGNVGIGTTAPTAGKLQVDGNIISLSATNGIVTARSTGADGNNAYLQVIGGTTGADWLIGTNRSSLAGSAENLFFYKNVAGTGTTGTKMMISASGNVGIGTTTPTAKLDISQIAQAGVIQPAISITGSYADAAAGKSIDFYVNNTTYRSARIANLISNLAFYTSSSYSTTDAVERMRINELGNVGIGTTSPTYKLSVVGTGATSQLFLNDGSTGGGTVTSAAASGITVMGGARYASSYYALATAAGGMNVYNGTLSLYNDAGLTVGNIYTPTARLVINSSGNVGIGTTTPNKKLTIGTENVYVDSASAPGGLSDVSALVGSAVSGQTVSYDLGVNDGTRRSWAKFFFTDDVQDSGAWGLWNSWASAGGQPFVIGQGNSEVFRITRTGNVGIGTTTPSRKLEIYSSTAGTTVAGLKLKNQGLSIDTASAIDFDFFGSDSIGARIAGIRTNAGNFESALAFYTNTGASGSSISEAMRIDNKGNVGIGTTGPTSLLQLQTAAGTGAGTLETYLTISNRHQASTGSDYTGTPGIIFQHYGYTNQPGDMTLIAKQGGSIKSIRTNTFNTPANSDADLAFSSTIDNVDTEKMRITSAGNVGIGITAPTQKLDVAGNISVNTNGTNVLISSYKGANSDGNNVWIGGGGQNSTGAIGGPYKGAYNTANGYRSLYLNTTGYHNTVSGYYTLYSNTTGYDNTANGYLSMFLNTEGRGNTASGAYSMYSNTEGYNNTAYGMMSMYFNTTGHSNAAYGSNSLSSNTTGYENTAIGSYALNSNTTGYSNAAYGSNSLSSNTTGYENTAIGQSSLRSNTTGYHNTVSGYESMRSNTFGVRNTAYGVYSLFSNTEGSGNTANGIHSLYSNINGNNNVASGAYSMYSNTEGLSNVAYGYQALYLNTTGNINVASGAEALYSNTTGLGNIASGRLSLSSNTTGNFNIAIGGSAGAYLANGLTENTTGDFNVFIGTNTKALTDNDQNEIVIGYDATGAGSNTVTLGNTSITKTLLNGSVGIGDGTPDALLDVKGTVCLDLNGDDVCTDNTAALSDSRLKTAVIDMKDNLSLVRQLRPVRFTWNGLNNTGNAKSIGFLAQEVEMIFPELVITDTAGYKNLDYSKLTAVLAGSIQELDLNLKALSGITTPIVGSENESFVTSFFNNLFAKITVWLADAGNGIKNILAQEIDTKNLCVSDETGEKTCITKSQLDALLLNTITPSSAPLPDQGGSGESDPIPTPENTESGASEPLTCTPPQILNDTGDTCVDPIDIIDSGTESTNTESIETIPTSQSDTTPATDPVTTTETNQETEVTPEPTTEEPVEEPAPEPSLEV